jgi:hypothetical protein
MTIIVTTAECGREMNLGHPVSRRKHGGAKESRSLRRALGMAQSGSTR